MGTSTSTYSMSSATHCVDFKSNWVNSIFQKYGHASTYQKHTH